MLDQLSADGPAVDARAPGLALLALRADEQDVLVVLGEADIATADLLRRLVLRALPAPPRQVVLELGALAFCDVRGLDALRDIACAAECAGVGLTFRGGSEQLLWLQQFVPARPPGSPGTPAALDDARPPVRAG